MFLILVRDHVSQAYAAMAPRAGGGINNTSLQEPNNRWSRDFEQICRSLRGEQLAVGLNDYGEVTSQVLDGQLQRFGGGWR
jgi:hypothetical protein